MDAFPAFVPLTGRIVAIAGEGPAADAKARLFEGSPAEVRRVADPYDPASYAGAALAFIALDSEADAARAAEAARTAGAWVNVVDRAALSDFTTPAVIDRGEVVAAIGTGGASPMLATMLRHDIEVRVPAGAGRVAALFRRTQDLVRHALPDLTQRRAFLRAALTGNIAEAAMAGDMGAAETLLKQALESWRQPQGRVQVIDARGPADLITLRAARALAAADVLVIDAEADPEIVALARRDAERLESADLAQLAADGLRVARLIAHSGWRAEVDALVEAGVETEVLPISG